MKRTISPAALLGALFIALYLGHSPSRGELITFQFEGTVTELESLARFIPGLEDIIDMPAVGTPIHGSYTFDSTADNTSSSDSSGDYRTPSPDGTLSISIGEFELRGNANRIRTRHDQYSVDANELSLSSHAELSNILDRNSFGLVIQENNLFDDFNLPVTPPSFSEAPIRAIVIILENNVGASPIVGILGTLDSLTVIPEPSSNMLVASGLMLLVWIRK